VCLSEIVLSSANNLNIVRRSDSSTDVSSSLR
jgi:hypothetical protein